MVTAYTYGRRKELQLAEALERRGFSWERAKGSRGPVDLVANKGRLNLAIQVKSTRSDVISYTRLRIRHEENLLSVIAGTRATPVLALISRNYFWLLRIPDGMELLKGRLVPLRYRYLDEN
jgi:Holliday junction resolvase